MTSEATGSFDQPTEELSDEMSAFARAFVELSRFAERYVHDSQDGPTVREAALEHLGVDPGGLPAVSTRLPSVERPNLQLALDALVAEDEAATVLGIDPEVENYGGFSFSGLLAGRFRGPNQITSLVYDDLPAGVDRTLRCVAAGVWLLRHDGTPVVVGLTSGERHGPPEMRSPRVEVFAADIELARAFSHRLQELRHELNVYRGQILMFGHSEYGEAKLKFMPRPDVSVDDVVLPAETLASIRRHTIGIAERADALRRAGQHLKRGVLLYGPPGTGKTHTINHLLSTMSDRTAVILQGSAVGALGYAAAIVRSLTPAMLVIEDIDIIANERGSEYGREGHPLLFELLNEMDGLDPADDVLFVLTTNRPDVLEPALAARPGRVDHAVEIGLPAADDRRHLLTLYLPRADGLRPATLDEVVDRTAGTTASFMKELARRATFVALEAQNGTTGDDPVVVDDGHLIAALDALLTDLPLSRALFGDRP